MLKQLHTRNPASTQLAQPLEAGFQLDVLLSSVAPCDEQLGLHHL